MTVRCCAPAGRVRIASTITGEEQSFSFAVLHFGDQNITAAVKAFSEADKAGFEAFMTQAAVGSPATLPVYIAG